MSIMCSRTLYRSISSTAYRATYHARYFCCSGYTASKQICIRKEHFSLFSGPNLNDVNIATCVQLCVVKFVRMVAIVSVRILASVVQVGLDPRAQLVSCHYKCILQVIVPNKILSMQLCAAQVVRTAVNVSVPPPAIVLLGGMVHSVKQVRNLLISCFAVGIVTFYIST